MAGVALANMGWVGVAEIGLALKVEWGPVFAGESRAEAYRYGDESLLGRRRPTVIPRHKRRRGANPWPASRLPRWIG